MPRKRDGLVKRGEAWTVYRFKKGRLGEKEGVVLFEGWDGRGWATCPPNTTLP